MRRTTLLALPFFTLAAACSDVTLPNARLYFTDGKESDSLASVDHYALERIDAKGKSKKLFEGAELPETFDMGNSGTYRFRATGYDAAGIAIARGETFLQDVGLIPGAEVPIFVSRTDRMTIADDNFAVAPGEYPKVGLIKSSMLWLWTNPSTDHITTDAYSVAYWTQINPQGRSVDFTSINCPTTPCEWKSLVMIGGYTAIAIADEWAIWVDEGTERSGDYDLPEDLDSFSLVAGGRVLPGANGTAFLVGGARASDPTEYNLSFSAEGESSVAKLSAPRSGAATLFEAGVGLVVVGGSNTGVGVERIAPNETKFVALNYPADPTKGAALIREDETHVLRAGGRNEDGTPAPTVRIDVTCASETCEAEPLPDLVLPATAAKSFYDSDTGDSIIVGEDDQGVMLVYRFIAESKSFVPIEVPDNQSRIHATAVGLANRKVALIGGMDPAKPTSSRSILSFVSF